MNMTDEPTLLADWRLPLLDQLRWHWEGQLRPRFAGLTDAEYFWEPVPGCWSLRPRAESATTIPAGSGALVADFAFPPPDPAPVTTIAWRLGHLIVGVFGARNFNHFGGPPLDYPTAEWPETAAEALVQLDAGYDRWIRAISALDLEALSRPLGPTEGPYAAEPMVALVLHIHREVIHHGAEIALLRDLYRAAGGRSLA
jgi:hypothetical protein